MDNQGKYEAAALLTLNIGNGRLINLPGVKASTGSWPLLGRDILRPVGFLPGGGRGRPGHWRHLPGGVESDRPSARAIRPEQL